MRVQPSINVFKLPDIGAFVSFYHKGTMKMTYGTILHYRMVAGVQLAEIVYHCPVMKVACTTNQRISNILCVIEVEL